MKSDLVTGPVVVGVAPTLPVEGVSLFLGNDLAGEKVIADPIVSNQPISAEEPVQEDPDVYPACAVTRAMSKKQQEDVPPVLADVPDGYEVDLCDTFLADVDNTQAVKRLDAVKSEHVSTKLTTKNPASPVNLLKQAMPENCSLSRKKLLEEQMKDSDLVQLRKKGAHPQRGCQGSRVFDE